jgi:hypothetical protein
MTILSGAVEKPGTRAFDNDVTVWWRGEDDAGDERLPIAGMPGRKPACSGEDSRQDARAGRGDMKDYEYSRGEVEGQGSGQADQGLDTSRRRSDGYDGRGVPRHLRRHLMASYVLSRPT